MDQTILQQLFSAPSDAGLLVSGQYQPILVALSLTVAICASWIGLQMAGQAKAGTSRTLRGIALLTGSLALGSGVWAMHFIGMLAFNLCTEITYDPGITLLSMLPSLGASAVALSITRRSQVTPLALLCGGVLVGAGIGTMHYMGMAAMQMSLALRYDPLMFALSIVVAVVLATTALWVRFGLRQLRWALTSGSRLALSAVFMGCAIAGMHYTGMAAARFVGSVPPDATAGPSSTFLALAITLITAAFTVFVMGANGLLRYRELYRHLRQSESWLRALLTTTIDGVITVDNRGTIQEFNASAERIFGWTRAEMVGRSVGLLMADPLRSEREGLLHFLRNGDASVTQLGTEQVGVRKDGSAVPIRRALGHARLGEQDLYVLFITDVSEQRAMEKALRESEQQFRSLIGNIPGISFRCLAATGQPLVFLSDGVEHVAGYPAADFTGPQRFRTINQLIIPDDLPRVNAAIEMCIDSEQPYQLEFRMRHADGTIRWIWEHGAVVRDAHGDVAWLDGVMLDISERRHIEEDLREAKEKAEQAAAARANFVANMSHEIRTPMNSILGFTDVLLDGPLEAGQRRHLDTVRSSGRSLLRLLNEILDTAKLDKGAMELELADYNLLALIDEMSSTYGSAARSKGLAVDIGYAPELPKHLHGDELRVRQVFTNLLDNAIKFTAAGKVTLRASERDGQLHVLVQDTGIGIAPDRLAAIFDPFTQADASMTRRYGGTGLGTTISKQLVELMGGRIWAESAPGEGTAFHVVLPLRRALAEPGAVPAEELDEAELPPLRVLAADDVAQNLELLALLLGKRGHTLSTASNGSDAARMAAEQSFDVILMDVQMPQVDGLAATRAIRTAAVKAQRPRVPIVAMTASVLEEHRRASSAAGMDGFASKPVDWRVLSHEIARVLGLAAPGTRAGAALDSRRVLNYRAGRLRWDDDEAAYLSALARYEHEHGAAAQQLLALHAKGDAAALAAHAHRVRGVAANLGLEQLAQTLAQLEQAAAETHGAALDGALQRLTAQAEAAATAIRARRPAAAAPAVQEEAKPVAPAPFDAAGVRDAAAALLQSLKRGALDDAALARLTSGLQGHVSGAPLAQLHMALADFDFILAQTRLAETLAAAPALAPETSNEPHS